MFLLSTGKIHNFGTNQDNLDFLGALKAQFYPLHSRRQKVFSQRHLFGSSGTLFIKIHEKYEKFTKLKFCFLK